MIPIDMAIAESDVFRNDSPCLVQPWPWHHDLTLMVIIAELPTMWCPQTLEVGKHNPIVHYGYYDHKP